MKSEIQQEDELSEEIINSTVSIQHKSPTKYDTSSATELLKKLTQEGKIKMPNGSEQ